jgi:two-component system LytT family sensor kinase
MLRKRKRDEDSAPLKKTIAAFLHGGYWLIYLLLLTVIFAAAARIGKTPLALPTFIPLLVLCVAPNVISFYSFYLLLFARFLARRRLFRLIISGASVCLFSAVSGALLSLVFFGFEQPIFADAREFFFLTASFFALAAIHGSIALVLRGFVVWYDEIKLKEELARKNFEMELSLIKSQINPHFLFNTLNNIDVLIGKDAAKASEYLNKLSAILRYMVYETAAERIPLAVELEYIEKYLDLQKIRTANPDYVEFQTTGEAGNFAVAPMLFFPFVENAFKHTENKKNAHSIRIKLLIEENKLVFECENSYQTNGSRKPDFGGVGNALVKKRLTLIYPDRHDLEIKDEGGIYRVKLTLYEN